MSRVPHPYTLADARFFLHEVAPLERVWGIEVRGEGLAGVGGLAIRPESQELELGYWLGQAFWGRGYATEAAGLILGHAWAAGATHVVSGYFDGNERSRHVLDKLGFRFVGHSTRPNLARGTTLPHVDVKMTRPAVDTDVGQ